MLKVILIIVCVIGIYALIGVIIASIHLLSGRTYFMRLETFIDDLIGWPLLVVLGIISLCGWFRKKQKEDKNYDELSNFKT